MDKHDYKLPYKYFRDAHQRILERTQPELVPPMAMHKALMRSTPNGTQYLMNIKTHKLITKNGDFKPPYYSAEDLLDYYEGHDAFVFCPGPTMGEVDLSVFKGKLTLAANSAGFKFTEYDPTFWVMFESNFLIEFNKWTDRMPRDRAFIMTARCAVRWRDMYKKTHLVKAVYVPRFEEMHTMPHRTPSVCTMGMIVSAWWMGAKRIWISGLDLSRPGGQPYVKGVPYGKDGATGPIKEQHKAMVQLQLPDVEIMNASPHTRFLPFKQVSYEELMEAARAAPDIGPPPHDTHSDSPSPDREVAADPASAS
jgi:hypothetical protein